LFGKSEWCVRKALLPTRYLATRFGYIRGVFRSVGKERALNNKGEVCLEEEVEKRRRSGMTTDEIAQDMGVAPAWVESLVSMVEVEDSSTAEREEAEA
jgi:hypothetical protein